MQRRRSHGPDVAFVASVISSGVHAGFVLFVSVCRSAARDSGVDGGLHQLVEFVFAWLFGEQKHLLVGLGQPVLTALGHGVRFVPDDLVSQDPAIVDQRECDAPGHTQQMAFVVGVAKIQPERTIVFEDALNRLKDGHQAGHILGNRFLVSDFACASFVVAQLKIRRGSDGRLNRFFIKPLESFDGVISDNHPLLPEGARPCKSATKKACSVEF